MTSRLVLVIGDLHIPDRALDIPAKFKKLLTPGKIGQTLCLGNLTDKPTYEYLRSIAPDLKIVKGKFDADATSLPLSQVVTHGSLRTLPGRLHDGGADGDGSHARGGE